MFIQQANAITLRPRESLAKDSPEEEGSSQCTHYDCLHTVRFIHKNMFSEIL